MNIRMLLEAADLSNYKIKRNDEYKEIKKEMLKLLKATEITTKI